MRIGYISQFYDPEQGAAAVPGAMVRALTNLGHEVKVLTAFPNYPYGKTFDGHRQSVRRLERLNGVPVMRVPLYPSHDRSAVRRGINELSFAASAATVGVRHLRDVDVCMVYSSPATAALPALMARGLWRKPFLLFVQDLWPDTVLASGFIHSARVAASVERTLTRYCDAVYRSAGRVAVISPGMEQLLIDRGVQSSKVEVIYNWADESVFGGAATTARPLPERSGLTVMYAGSIGDLQGLDVAVRAMTRLRDLDDVTLQLVGTGVAVESLRRLAAQLGVQDRVAFLGRRPQHEMVGLMQAADVQLVTLRDLPLFHLTMPSKVQTILAMGSPVIVSAPGDVANLVQRAGAGFSCPPGDADALAAAIRRMHALPPSSRARLGDSGKAFYDRELSERIGAERLVTALASTAADERSRRR